MTLPPTLSFFPMCSIIMSPSATPFLYRSVFSPLLFLLHSSFYLLLLTLSPSLNSSLNFRFLPSFSSLPLFLSLSPLLLYFPLLLSFLQSFSLLNLLSLLYSFSILFFFPLLIYRLHTCAISSPSQCVLQRDIWTCSSTHRICSEDIKNDLGNKQ